MVFEICHVIGCTAGAGVAGCTIGCVANVHYTMLGAITVEVDADLQAESNTMTGAAGCMDTGLNIHRTASIMAYLTGTRCFQQEGSVIRTLRMIAGTGTMTVTTCCFIASLVALCCINNSSNLGTADWQVSCGIGMACSAVHGSSGIGPGSNDIADMTGINVCYLVAVAQ